MALRLKTVEYPFPTNTGTLATNTTLGTATRYDFSAITLDIPETTSRTFRSVVIQLGFRDAMTTIYSFTGIRIGIKLGAASFDDDDVSLTQSNTGDHYSFMVTRQVTSYFTTNFGSGASQTCQVGIAVSTATASSITCISCKLFVTYEYSDTEPTTLVKTVRIPIETGTAGTLTDTLTEIGTNQVPDLDDLLPETTKSYKHIWFEMLSNEAATTADYFNLAVALDSESESTRATLNQDQISSPCYWDIWVRNDMSTADAHAFKARSTVASRFANLAVVLCVTYTYDASSTTIINSVILPVTFDNYIDSTTSDNNDVPVVSINIQEPGTITLKQSGIVFYKGMSNASNTTVFCRAGGTSQSTRTYTGTLGTHVGGMACFFVHRIDSGSAAGGVGALVRGMNYLAVHAYASYFQGQSMTGLAYLNYTSGKATAGEGSHLHTIHYNMGVNYSGVTVQYYRDSGSTAPVVPESSFFLNSIWLWILRQGVLTTDAMEMKARLQTGEGVGAIGTGWLSRICKIFNGIEQGYSTIVVDFSALFRPWPSAASHSWKCELETARIWRLKSIGGAANMFSCFFTYHSITQSVTGTISGSGGGTVYAYLHNKSTGELLGDTSRSGNGSYSITCYDDTVTKFVDAFEDSTHVGRSTDGTT